MATCGGRGSGRKRQTCEDLGIAMEVHFLARVDFVHVWDGCWASQCSRCLGMKCALPQDLLYVCMCTTVMVVIHQDHCLELSQPPHTCAHCTGFKLQQPMLCMWRHAYDCSCNRNCQGWEMRWQAWHYGPSRHWHSRTAHIFDVCLHASEHPCVRCFCTFAASDLGTRGVCGCATCQCQHPHRCGRRHTKLHQAPTAASESIAAIALHN